MLILLRENFLPPSASTKSILLSNTRSHIPNLIHNSAFHTPEGTNLDPIKPLVHAGFLFCIIPHLAFNITFSSIIRITNFTLLSFNFGNTQRITSSTPQKATSLPCHNSLMQSKACVFPAKQYRSTVCP